MAPVEHIYATDTLIGMTILSRASGNRLGTVRDLIIDPGSGMLGGLVVIGPDGDERVLNYHDIYSFGQDAVMAQNDEGAVIPAEGELLQRPCAKRDLVGANIISEGGKILGRVSNVFLHLTPPPLAIYEVRDSMLDKLLGRVLYVPASFARALSSDTERIIVPEDTVENAASSLEDLAENHIRPLEEEETQVRKVGVRPSFGTTA
jgi:uncharacterized protein YrrD